MIIVVFVIYKVIIIMFNIMRTILVHLFGFIRSIMSSLLSPVFVASSRSSRSTLMMYLLFFFLVFVNLLVAKIIINWLFSLDCCNAYFLHWLASLSNLVALLLYLKSIALRNLFLYNSRLYLYFLLQKLWFWLVLLSFLLGIPSVVIVILLWLLLLFFNSGSEILVFAVFEYWGLLLTPGFDFLLFVVFRVVLSHIVVSSRRLDFAKLVS